jgi:CubicO group peptidase (beta-lactamase class C family)
MYSRIHATALAALLVSSSVQADTFPQSAPEKVGLSGERLQRIGSALKADVEKGRLPGAVVAVARKGQLAYFETVGFLDAARKVAMPRDAIFSLASMSKPMTSIAIMMLIEEGRLFLSDPVGKYLPALANMQVGVVKTDAEGKAIVETEQAKRQPTIQDLLRHTSGLTYGGRGETPVHKLWPAGSAVAAVTYTGPELVAHLGTLPLLYQPGTVWDYGLSTDVLGLVVEAITGQSLGAFLQERLWGPLGMVDASFTIPDDKKGRYALAFPNDPLTNKPQSVLHAGKPAKFECGGACAVSTTIDYLRFAQMLANGGILDGKRIVSRTMLEMMTADQLGPEVRARTTSPILGEGYTFGLGFAVRQDAGISPLAGSKGDYTWGGAYGTYFWVDPKEELVVVFMSAAPGDIRVHYRILLRNLVMQAIAN